MASDKVKIKIKQLEILVDGKKIKFDNPKAKELFLLMAEDDREYVGYKEMFDYLWTRNGFKKYDALACKRTVFSLQKAFEAAGMRDIINVDPGGCGLNREKIKCIG